MENKGIMEKIREHLAQGRTSGELIGLGFRPGTVYKVQRQSKAQGRRDSLSGTSHGTSPVTGSDTGAMLAEDDDDLEWAWLEGEANPVSAELFQARTDELETQVQDLRKQVEALENLSQSLHEITQQIQLKTRRTESLETQVEALTRARAAQEKQIALWQEHWDQLMPLITALCTQIHCADEAAVVNNPPQCLQQSSSKAMEKIRKHSQYRWEKAKQDELEKTLNEWALGYHKRG